MSSRNIRKFTAQNPSFSHCRFNLLGDTNSMAQPAQIERCNKRMANSLSSGHKSPRSDWSASCSSYCSLGTRWKGSRTGCPASLSKYIVIGMMSMELSIVHNIDLVKALNEIKSLNSYTACVRNNILRIIESCFFATSFQNVMRWTTNRMTKS